MKSFLILFGIIVLGSMSLANAQEFEELGVKVETVAENLKVPWAIAFSPDGRIFFTERGGELRVIQDGKLNPVPVANLNVGGGEGGLLGVALDPDFEENHYLYLYYSYNDFLSTFNKVVRFTEDNNQLSDEKILVDKIPGAAIHDGGRLKFGPDGKLYITTGDAANAGLSQDLNSLAGKILRVNSDGSIPRDNPFSDSLIFSYGHRNPQGLDWHPESGVLVSTEHGPSGERGFAHDEVNVIQAGKNYGWPEVVGDEAGPDFVNPIIHTGRDTWAPSGASFYDSENISEWYEKYFVATLRGNHLRMLDLDLENNQVISNVDLFSGEFGRLRDASMGHDGNLYLLTSNQDGRGTPVSNDDRILRVIPMLSEIVMGDSSLSPKAQMKSGIDPHMVQCKEGLELIFKDKIWSPACVKPSSVQRLIEIGWASKHDLSHGINMPK
jgi:glucose/arabinose dehydrogenase